MHKMQVFGHPHVFVETGGLAEALAAHPALVGPVLLVHMQDVDAQAVPLLERPVHDVYCSMRGK